MEVSLQGRTALITGGSRGLGLAMASLFARSGADVAIVARRPDVLEEARAQIAAAAPGRTIAAVPGDVSKGEQIQPIFDKVLAALGRVDILVNNAGTAQTGAFESIADETWRYDFDLKLFAAIRFCRLALPAMKERRWGRVLNVLNTHAKAPPPNGAPTAVTRAAGMALTKVLAGECAPHNVLVNALCTGILVSEQWEERHKKLAPDKTFEQFVSDEGKTVPIGRMGNPEEFANMACFLASDAASYITGCAINVDGGRSPVV
ncbi:MAG: SDR family oxidoreductase [SAR324 cluster bacterium]|nr:SDR family oxidoreductase [SAR324 cluster bacterium]